MKIIQNLFLNSVVNY